MQDNFEELANLIGNIYDCAMGQGRWPSVLAQICEQVDAFCGDIQNYDPATGQASFVALHGWSQEGVEAAARHVHLNPLAPIALTTPLGEPVWFNEICDFETFRKNAWYRAALERDGHRDMIHVPMVRNVTRVSGWGISRNLEKGPFTPEHVFFARLLTPHIRRALEISALIDRTEARAATLASLLDAMTCAALVVDADGRIKHANRLAEAELERGRVLRIHRDRVSSPIDAVVRLIAAMTRRTTSRGDDVEVDDPIEGRVQVSWTRLDGEGHYLLLARKPAEELVTPLQTAVRLFALTPGETQVLAALLHGRSLDEAGEWLGVSRSTVKTHLNSIFTKTGERRQPDLVRRVIGLKTPVG